MHDAYAVEYDAQVQAYDCYMQDMLLLASWLLIQMETRFW
jgi:hypothetical protein